MTNEGQIEARKKNSKNYRHFQFENGMYEIDAIKKGSSKVESQLSEHATVQATFVDGECDLK